MQQQSFDIRWALYYSDTTYIYGSWSYPDHASHQRMEGLERVEVHARDKITGEIHRILCASASLFVRFEWMAVASFVPGSGQAKGPTKLPGKIVGISLILTDGRICQYFIDGTKREEKL